MKELKRCLERKLKYCTESSRVEDRKGWFHQAYGMVEYFLETRPEADPAEVVALWEEYRDKFFARIYELLEKEGK